MHTAANAESIGDLISLAKSVDDFDGDEEADEDGDHNENDGDCMELLILKLPQNKLFVT